MIFSEIALRVETALKCVMRFDWHLLVHDLSECSISHRFAMYLDPLFIGYDVDCDYKGNIDSDNGKKYIMILKETAKRFHINIDKKDNELFKANVYPDIIIHKRGINGPLINLLVIEVKKSSNQESREWDAEKITLFTSQDDDNRYNYSYGAFILFNVGDNPGFTVEWYRNGNIFQPN